MLQHWLLLYYLQRTWRQVSLKLLRCGRGVDLDLLHESLLLLWPLWWRNKWLVPFAILNWSQSSRAWRKFKGSIRLQECEILSFHWVRETVQIEVIIVRPNFHTNSSEQFMIRECTRPSFEGSVNMIYKDVSTKMITWEKKSHVVRPELIHESCRTKL